MGEKKRRTPIDISDLIEVNFTEVCHFVNELSFWVLPVSVNLV